MTLAVRTPQGPHTRPLPGRADAVDRIVAAVASASRTAPALTPTRELVGRIRQAAVDLELATVLTLRAERLDNPALASVLRERATLRRHRAERIRADLAARGVLVPRPAWAD
jgi:hypothetical protein